MTNTKTKSGPALQVLGVSKTQGRRAVRWLRDRCVIAFYHGADRSLNAFETKHGREWTYEVMSKALEATR